MGARQERQALAERADAALVRSGMLEAGKRFRRVSGHLHLPQLRAALDRETAETVGAACHDETVNVA